MTGGSIVLLMDRNLNKTVAQWARTSSWPGPQSCLYIKLHAPPPATHIIRSPLPEEEGSPAKKLKLEMEAADPDEASTSGLGNAPTENGSPDAAEPSVSQSDSENKDPSSHAGQEEDFPKKRGRPSKRFLRKKYRRYMNRK